MTNEVPTLLTTGEQLDPNSEALSLWTATRMGDAESEKRFLLIIRERLTRWARGRCSPSILDDFVAEVVPDIYFRLGEFEPERCDFWSWVYWKAAEALRNTSLASSQVYISKHRYHDRERKLAGPWSFSLDCVQGGIASLEADAAFHDETVLPRAAVEQSEQCEILRSLLPRLTERQRTILTRSFGLNGVPQENMSEIAEDLGISRQAVADCVQYAIGKLRALYAEII